MKVTTDDILKLLADGPLTSKQACEFFPGSDHRTVARVISDIRSRKVRRVRISGYVFDEDGTAKRYPRPVYALGKGPDAPKPAPLTGSEMTMRWYKKTRRPKAASSVWAWAQSFRR